MLSVSRVLNALVLCLLLLPAGIIAADAQYVGAKKCKMCHNKKDQTKQFDIWKGTSHANAYATLATDKAKEFATKAGIKGDPQKAGECLECHVAGYGLDSTNFGKSFKLEDGVQCESCHGPGSKYKSTKIMSKTKYAEAPKVQRKLAIEAGLTLPDEKTCKKCHNKRSPAFKGFDYKTFYEKIKHEYAK